MGREVAADDEVIWELFSARKNHVAIVGTERDAYKESRHKIRASISFREFRCACRNDHPSALARLWRSWGAGGPNQRQCCCFVTDITVTVPTREMKKQLLTQACDLSNMQVHFCGYFEERYPQKPYKLSCK